MVRSFLCIVFCLPIFLISTFTQAQSHFRREGYVTRAEPPFSFRLNQQQIVATAATRIFMGISNPPVEASFAISVITPGKYVSVNGVEDKQTKVITAKKIVVFDGDALIHRSGQALEDQAPALTKEGNGWRGEVYADGYAIRVGPKTTVTLAQGMGDAAVFHPDWRVSYQADRQSDGSLLARSLSFAVDKNVVDKQKYRIENDFKVDLPDYDKKVPGKVHFFMKTQSILPDRQLQDAMNTFGQKLVPAWQRNLPDSDPAKIHFRFFVLQKTKTLEQTMSNDTGTVLIPAQLILKLQNEAQLASVLSADIAGVIGSDIYRSRAHKHTQEAISVALIPVPFGLEAGEPINHGIFSASYWTPLIEHEYRVGLRYVVEAGYDPREEPIALQRISAKHPNSTTGKRLPALANYMDGELGFDYMAMDFSKLIKGETEYEALRNMTFAADKKLNKDGKARLTDN